MATPTVREFLHNNAGGTSITFTTGAGTAVNDLLVVFHASDGSTAAGMTTPTPGTWTQQDVGDLGSGTSHIKVWTRLVASGGANSVTVPANGSTDIGAHLYVLSGVDTSTPVDAHANATGAASTSHVAPSVSPASSDALLLCGVVSEVFSFGNYTAVSGSMTNLTEDDMTTASTFATMATARQNLSASGATGTRTFTYSQSKAFAAVSIAIKGASGGGSTIDGTATLTGAGSVAALVTQTAGKTLVGAGTVAARATQSIKATLTGAGTVAATGSEIAGTVVDGTAALTSTGDLTGLATMSVTATLTGAGVVNASQVRSEGTGPRAVSSTRTGRQIHSTIGRYIHSTIGRRT